MSLWTLIRHRLVLSATRRIRARRETFAQVQVAEARLLLTGLVVGAESDHEHDNDHCHCGQCCACGYPAIPTNTGNSGVAASGGVALYPLANTFQLHSRPSATKTIYLDFNGHYFSGTLWNSQYNNDQDFSLAGYSFEGDATFSNNELTRIQRIWARVAEDFAPFDVNVTTQEPPLSDLVNTGGADTRWGIRTVIGETFAPHGSAGGVAWIGSFNWDTESPALAFEDNMNNGDEKSTAECISHEVGHTLGLNHDGRTTPVEGYYGGHGSGETGWAPIMGIGYSQNLTQWSRGEYTAANNTQDDLNVITTQNGFGYRTDDVLNTLSSTTAITSTTSGVTTTFGRWGVIERNTDVDVYRIDLTSGGDLSLNVQGGPVDSNLDIRTDLYDSAGTLLHTSNSTTLITAQVTLTLTTGTYYLKIDGVGVGSPTGTGYSDYGSLGQYWIGGTFTSTVNTAPVLGNQTMPNLASTSSVGTIIGTVAASDSDSGQQLTYTITAGNSAGAFAINASTGQITVANATALAGLSGTVQLTVQVTDNGTPALNDTGVVSIAVQSAFAPVYTGSSSYSFEEFSPRWTLIGTLTASDANGDGVSFSIVSGNPDSTLQLTSDGRLYVYHQDLTGLRHRGMFNLRVRMTDNSAAALTTDTDIKLFLTSNTRANTTVTSTVDGFVTDTDGDGFDGSDLINTTGAGLVLKGGTFGERGVIEFDLRNVSGNRPLKNAWLYFNTSQTTSETASVPIDIFGYSGNGVIEAVDASRGSKIGSRPLTFAVGINPNKIHAAQLDVAFVRGLVGAGHLGLVYRNDGTNDGVTVDSHESSVQAQQKPRLVLQFGDGSTTVVAVDSGSAPTHIEIATLNANGNSFSIGSPLQYSGNDWERFVTGDFNGDGRSDILGRWRADGQLWVCLGNSSGSYDTGTLWSTWPVPTTTPEIYVGDFDGDGKSDIAARYTGDWWVGRSTGTGFSNSKWGNWSTTTTWSNILLGDFNRDGLTDIAGRNTAGEWHVSRASSGSFVTSQWGLWSAGTAWVDVQVGDFNGDGRVDIAGRSSLGQWWVNRSTGTSFSSALFYGTWSIGTTWSDVRMADFNGDGRDDIIGRSSIGQWWVAECSTSGFVMKLLGSWSGPHNKWAEVQVGDFNRDGRADLVARNTLTNEIQTSLWSPTGFITTVWVTLPTAINRQWRLLSR